MNKLYPNFFSGNNTTKNRRNKKNAVFILLFSLLATGCSTLQESSKYQFSEGFYRVRLNDASTKRMYVDYQEEEDSLTIYPLRPSAQGLVPDTLRGVKIDIASEREEPLDIHYTFSQPSFDVDVLTIPLKYRPGTAGFPKQLNTSVQAAIYLGLRNDYYRMGYTKTPLGNYKRHFNHFGFSMGLFTGLGSSFINESVTKGLVEYEYDGVVLVNGVAGIIGINNFTLGLAVGVDHLMDQNREMWIYQRKPWVGLAFGLNLN